MSSERLQRIDRYIQEYIDTNQIAGAVTLVARRGEVVHLEAQGLRDREAGAADDARHHLRDGVDDQADRVGRAHDAVRGGALPARRPDLEVAAGVCGSHGAAARLPRGAAGGGRAAGHRAPRADAHLRPDHAAGQPRPDAGAARQGDERRQGPCDAARARPRGGRHPGLLPPGRPLAVRRLDELRGGAGRGNLRAVARRVPAGADLRAAGMEDTFYFVPRDKVDRVAAIYRPTADGTIELARAPKFVEPTRYFPGICGAQVDRHRLHPLRADDRQRRRARRRAPAGADDGQQHDHQPDRRAADRRPRAGVRVRPRLRHPDESGQDGRCAYR